jgi:FKBP-type peptidyl-prolyl cis-trans isomerase
MFGLFKKKSAQKTSVTPVAWMRWVAIAFVGYAVLTSYTDKKNTPEKEAVLEPISKVDELIESAKKTLKLEGVDGKFLPQMVKKLTIQGTLSGKGAFAICGQKVTIDYHKTTAEKTEDDTQKTLSFTIGDGTAPAYIDQGIVGMSKGGKRAIYTPENEEFEVQITDIAPELPDLSAYRILGDISENGEIYKCGEPAKLHISIWNVEGKKLFDSKEQSKEFNGNPIAFTIGKSEVFLGLEQGALGMTIGSKRSLIVPPLLQKTLNGNAPLITFPLPKNQTIIVDIESVI